MRTSRQSLNRSASVDGIWWDDEEGDEGEDGDEEDDAQSRRADPNLINQWI